MASTALTKPEIKKVKVLYVGGTIGMEQNEHNVYVPQPNKFFEKLRADHQMHDTGLANRYQEDVGPHQLVMPKFGNYIVVYELKEYDPLLDSSNMSPSEWIQIAKDIGKYYNDFDGFVILQGTDTLAYTSSALSFMLEGLQKPVILTGSQISFFDIRSDAQNNILSSLILAGCYNIPEVCILFANKLLRGNRTTKISSTHLDGFSSLNYPNLAEVEIDITVNKHFIMQPSDMPLGVHTNLNAKVGLLHLIPTITPSMCKSLLQCPDVEGLVLQSFGVGNIPSNQEELLEVIKEAVDQGKLIINVTQCPQGIVFASYETGQALAQIGVVSGQDMTTEAALTKLCYVLGIPELSYGERVEAMKTDLRGELTDNNNNNNNSNNS